MVNIFMDDLLGEGEYIRGKSEVKTLRLSGEKRQQLLENLQTVEVVNTNSALKLWNAYLKSSAPLLKVTFDSTTAKDERDVTFLTQMHPLVKQAAAYESTKFPCEIALSATSEEMAPQIRLLQNADQEVVDKLRSDILNTIPAWRNQMVLALGIEHTTRALNAQNALDEMTNELFRKNAETLKQGAIDAALASERSIVDVETLKKINADIITSINEVVKIHEEGSQKRAEAQEELVKIETELKDALLKAGSR